MHPAAVISLSVLAAVVVVVGVLLAVIFTSKENRKERERVEKELQKQQQPAVPLGAVESQDEGGAALRKHLPVYHSDGRERLLTVSLNRYIADKTVAHEDSVTGVAVRKPQGGWLLHYFTYYEHDGGLLVGGQIFDAHPYDLEHLVVETAASGEVEGVLYQPHGSKEHFWIRGAADLDRILVNDLRPLVFCSYGKHGQYPVSGTIHRYGGFASDHCHDPVLKNYTVVAASAKVLKVEKIDGVFSSVPPKLRAQLASKPIVGLDRVRKWQLFKLP